LKVIKTLYGKVIRQVLPIIDTNRLADMVAIATRAYETRKFVKKQFVTHRIIFSNARSYWRGLVLYTEQLAQPDTPAKHFHLAELSTTLRAAA